MYKIIYKEKVIDVVETPHFFRILPTGHVTFTDKSSAQGIVGSDNKTLYAFTPVKQRKLDVVTIEEITFEELKRLQSLLSSGQDIIDETALTEAKHATIRKLSNQCKSKIISGFSVVLSDRKSYSFQLTIEDQLNLMSIEGQLNAGVDTFLYHATGQSCKYFSREDMIKIIAAFRRHTLYHTTYFNVAKQYINSLASIEKVTMFTYGTDVSEIVDDKAIKQILKNGGNL